MGWRGLEFKLMKYKLTERIRAYIYLRSGFTLVEVLITMAILSIGILGVSGLAVHTINGRARSLELTSGTILAQDRLEFVKAGGYWWLESMIGIENYGTIGADTPETTDDYPNYWRNTVVQDDYPEVGVAMITVKVRWKGGSSGRTITSQVRTIISQPPGLAPDGYVEIP